MMVQPQITIRPVKIVIVDDHPNTATMLARVLSRFDTPVDVITANSGEDALNKIGDQMIDILITDFMMPGMNGLELIEKLKGDQKPSHTILITAYDTPGLAITVRRLNVHDYLVKPVQPEKIRSIVSKVIEEIRPTNKLPDSPSKKSFKILIADDYPDNLRLLSTRLQSEGYTFVSALDGVEALEKTRQEKPDLLLLDVNMPRKDGFEVLEEMRSDPEIAHIPVIIITAARIGPKDIREGLTLGADDYIIKPFDWRDLAARIRSKLRVKQAEDVLRRRNRELGILPEIGQELSARLDITELSEVIVNRTVTTLEAQSARLDIFEPDGKVFCRQRFSEDKDSQILDATRDQVVTCGAVKHVLTVRKGVIVENCAEDEHWQKSGDNNNGSAIAVPLLGRMNVIGVLTLTHDKTAFFNDDHLALLQAIASQAAIAIENTQLFNVEHKRVQELAAINQLTREFNKYTYSRNLLESLPGLVQQAFDYPVVVVWNGVKVSNHNKMELCSIAGNMKEIPEDALKTTQLQVAAISETWMVSQVRETPSLIAVPLMRSNQLIGALAILSPYANAFQESDRAVMETLATQVSSALERIGLFESVEQEQRRLLAVLRSAADAILVIDNEMCLTLANPAGENLFNDSEARLDQPISADPGYWELQALLEQARTSGLHQQGEVNWPDGRTFSVVVTPIEDQGQVAVLHDVSRFKALAQLKNDYIATASHDLKNPIMAVLGYNDLLTKAGPLNEMQVDFSHRISSAAVQMRELVLNLLEISRLESGAVMKIEKLNFHQLLTEIAKELDDQSKGKNLIVNLDLCEAQPQVMGDRTLLQQVIRNLLGNAIKYTPEGGNVTIKSQTAEKDLLVEFHDTGIGIPEKDLPYIFEKFFRVETDETKDIEGTGLGLTIVKSILQDHHGSISVQSRIGEGSVFIVKLPLDFST